MEVRAIENCQHDAFFDVHSILRGMSTAGTGVQESGLYFPPGNQEELIQPVLQWEH